MDTPAYTDPVAKLLTLGMNNDLMVVPWPNYLHMGFTTEHIPELIRLVQDFELTDLPHDDEGREPDAVYGQMHAWRILTQLQATEAIPAFMLVLRNIDQYSDDFTWEELPLALGMFGEAAINPCCELLNDNSLSDPSRTRAADALAKIGQQHPELRRICVAALINSLAEYKHNGKDVNSFVISALADLKSQEASLLVEKVILKGYSDVTFSGDYNDYKESIGLRPQ